MKSEFLKRADQAAKAEADKRQAAGGAGNDKPTQTPGAAAGPAVTPVAAAKKEEAPPVGEDPNKPVQPTTTPPADVPAGGAVVVPPVSAEGSGAAIAAAGEDPEKSLLEQLKARGLDVNSMEELLQRVNQPAAAPKELTEEEKKKVAQERELRLLKEFQDEGGNMDDFYRLRRLGDVEDENLVREHFKTQMRELHPQATEDQLDDAFNRQYLIGEDYEPYESEYGKKKLKGEADQLKQSQLQPLSKVETQLQLKDEARKAAQEWGTRIDQFSQSMPRSFDIPLGKVGETDLGVFNYKLSDEEQRELLTDMKDPAYILRELQDKKTGKTDPAKLFELMRYKKLAEKMIRAAATANYSKGIEQVVKPLENFPNLSRGGTQSSGLDRTEERQQGEAKLKEDSRSILGASNNTRRKTLK